MCAYVVNQWGCTDFPLKIKPHDALPWGKGFWVRLACAPLECWPWWNNLLFMSISDCECVSVSEWGVFLFKCIYLFICSFKNKKSDLSISLLFHPHLWLSVHLHLQLFLFLIPISPSFYFFPLLNHCLIPCPFLDFPLSKGERTLHSSEQI